MPDIWDNFPDAEDASPDPWGQFPDAKELGARKESQPPQSTMEWLEDRARAWAMGSTFRFADEVAARMGSLGNTAMRGLGMDLPERNYADIKAEIAADQKRFEESNPKTALGLEIAGGMVTPAIGANVAARAGQAVANATRTGMIGRGVASGTLVGAPSGALYGAGASEADTAGGIAGDALKGAATGALAGGVAGAVAEPLVRGGIWALKNVIAPFANVSRGIVAPEQEALRRYATAAAEDARPNIPRAAPPLSETEFAAAQARGQPVLPLEMGGSNARALARASANTNPTAREILEGATDPRFASQGERAAEWLTTLGTTGGQSEAVRQQLTATARAMTAPRYAQAYREGAAGIDSRALTQLETAPALNRAMKEARERMANAHAVDGVAGDVEQRIVGQNGYTLEFWDKVKQSLDDRITDAQAKGRNGEFRDLTRVKERLVSELDRAVPSYADARNSAFSAFNASNAFEAGEKFATAGARNNNEAARAAIARMTPEERDLFGEAYLNRLIHGAEEGVDRRNLALTMANSKASRDRLEMALGPSRAREVEAYLHVENLMELSRKAISGNSTTARQLAEMGVTYGVGGGAATYGAYSQDPRALAVAAFLGGRKVAMSVSERKVSLELAKLLTSGNPQNVQQAIATIGATPSILNNLRRLAAPASGTAATQTSAPERQPAPRAQARDPLEIAIDSYRASRFPAN